MNTLVLQIVTQVAVTQKHIHISINQTDYRDHQEQINNIIRKVIQF